MSVAIEWLPAPSIDEADFRRVLGAFPTGVAAVTAQAGDKLLGMAVGSFMSISLDPPLVAFGVAETSSTWPSIEAVGSFSVSVLSQEQAHVCAQLATKGADKFADLDWAETPAGHPRFIGSLAWIDCEVDSVAHIGDHKLIVGRVTSLDSADISPGPLLYYKRSYGGFDDRTRP